MLQYHHTSAPCDWFLGRYFPEVATEEMLEEWRPLLCPFDVTMQRAISYLELYLPTTLPPELHHRGFRYTHTHTV